jgi:hypothetical protein
METTLKRKSGKSTNADSCKPDTVVKWRAWKLSRKSNEGFTTHFYVHYIERQSGINCYDIRKVQFTKLCDAPATVLRKIGDIYIIQETMVLTKQTLWDIGALLFEHTI